MHWLIYQCSMSIHVYFSVECLRLVTWSSLVDLFISFFFFSAILSAMCYWLLVQQSEMFSSGPGVWLMSFSEELFLELNFSFKEILGLQLRWCWDDCSTLDHEVWPFSCVKSHRIYTLLGWRIAHRQPTTRHHVICTVNQACIIALGIVSCWKLITS